MYDFHSHFIPNEVLDWVNSNKTALQVKREKRDSKKFELLSVGSWTIELKDSLVDLSRYLEERNQMGIQHSLVSPARQLFLYEFPEEITRELVQVYNQAMAEMARKYPERITALATLTFTCPDRAAQELRQSMEMGLRGAIIGPGASPYMLSDEFYRPFWQEANDRGAIIFIHPLSCEDPRLKRRLMPNLIGVLWETTVYFTDLLLSGLVDRYPKLKILVAHGGGFLPYQINRLNKGYENTQLVSGSINDYPAEYLRRFWYDTVLLNEPSLKCLLELVGEERIVPGSDFPLDLSSWPPVGVGDSGAKLLLAKLP